MANNLRFLPAGTNRFIVEMVDLDTTVGLFEAMSKLPIKGIVEAVPGARTVLVTYDPMLTDAGSLYEQIAALRPNTFRDKAGSLIEIPVVYDGEDLLFVADYLGWTVEDLIRRHTQATYTVAFTGFAPGFAYMTCDDPELNVPRRESPRVRIPAGAVALAGRFGGVYPSDTPGGWQLLGQTTIPMWDLSRDPAALLKPGDQVRFKQVTADKTAETHEKLPAAKSSVFASKGLKVQSSDRPALYQDAGRPGNAHQGVSQSGAADLQALREANLSVGNAPATPAIEVTYGGFSMLAEVPVTLAVAGAPAPLTISTKDGRVLYPPMDMPVALDAGDTLSLGIPKAGVRSYIALRGGYEIEQALGSSSTDTLARIGPAPIQVGDLILPAGKRSGSVRGVPAALNALPTGADVVVLDVVMGPRADWFTDEALRVFSSQEWTVTAESSRVGARLQGPVSLQRFNKDELPSEGTSRGSVQVPPSGKPVLFLADHPLTGGYPVIAVVAEYHLSLAAQVPIGARIRFNAVAAFDPQVKEFER